MLVQHVLLVILIRVGRPSRLVDPPNHDLGFGDSNLSAGKVGLIFYDFLCEGSRGEDSRWGTATAGEVGEVIC